MYAAWNVCVENNTHGWKNESLYGNIMLGKVSQREGAADAKREKVDVKDSIEEAEGRRESQTQRRGRKREGERTDQSCFPRFLQLLIRSSGRLRDASGFIPVVALWLWCRSGRFTVPPGLYVCQAGSLHNQATQERERKFSFLSPLLSLMLLNFFLLSCSPVSGSLSLSSVLPLIVAKSHLTVF